jgi:hypothetical protein
MKTPRQYVTMRLKKATVGPRARLVMLGGVGLRFNLAQEDPSAPDFPEKKLFLREDQITSLTASGDWDIRHAKAPEPSILARSPVQRRIGSKPAVEPPATEPK